MSELGTRGCLTVVTGVLYKLLLDRLGHSFLAVVRITPMVGLRLLLWVLDLRVALLLLLLLRCLLLVRLDLLLLSGGRCSLLLCVLLFRFGLVVEHAHFLHEFLLLDL